MIDPAAYGASYYNSINSRTAGKIFVSPPKAEAKPAAAAKVQENKPLPQEGSFLGFLKGLIDIINPLQHIPVISSIYRKITGDEISPAAEIAGGVLYGGIIGGAASVASIAYNDIKKSGEKNSEPVMVAGNNHPQYKISDIVWNEPERTAPQMQRQEMLALNMAKAIEKYNAAEGSAMEQKIISGVY